MIFGIFFCFILNVINFILITQTNNKLYELEELYWEKWEDEK